MLLALAILISFIGVALLYSKPVFNPLNSKLQVKYQSVAIRQYSIFFKQQN